MDMYQKRAMRKKNREQEQPEVSDTTTNINWYPGHMAKTRREIKEKLSLIDIVYEVVDARMPISSRLPDIDQIINNKPKIMVVTKYDLCDKEKTDELLKEYEKTHYIVKVNLLENSATKEVLRISHTLLKDLNEKRIRKGLKPRPVRALVVGVPNVGKSTLINNLVGRKAAVAANRPGVTKGLTWIRVNTELELLDSPGILWPKFETEEQALTLAVLTSIKEDILDTGKLAYFILQKMNELYPTYLKSRYDLEEIDLDDLEPILEKIAKKRGAFQKGGYFDYDRVYSIIIKDLKEGYLGNVTFDRI